MRSAQRSHVQRPSSSITAFPEQRARRSFCWPLVHFGIKVQETSIPDNYLVFAAGETDQIAGVEPEVKHGRFSYFVFKGLEGEADANADGKISAGEPMPS